MSPALLSAKLSMAILAALGAALITLVARLKRTDWTSEIVYGVAAFGLIIYFGEAVIDASLIDHTLVMWLYVLAGACLAGAVLLKRVTLPLWSTLTPMLAMAYLFAPATYWRSPLTLLLFIWCVFATIGFARGEEGPLVIDEAFPGRLPLRRPPRIRGAREMALASITSALALILGANLFWPAPPVETPATQEDSTETEAQEAPAESSQSKEAPAEEPVSYTARAGDSFKSIAKRLYRDASKAREIAHANPELKPNAKLRAGQKIKLPAPAK